MESRFARLLAGIATIVALTSLSTGPANAGTLTSASFTANGTGYAITNASNTRYDWRYTTATAGTTSRVEASVPGGTRAIGAKYAAFSPLGGNNNYVSTPDTVANSITGDIDIRAKVSMANWADSCGTFVNKRQTTQSYILRTDCGATGKLQFVWSSNGSSQQALVGNVLGFAPNSTHWVRVTFAVNSGGNAVANFYTSDDGSAWTSAGSSSQAGATTIYDGTDSLSIGVYAAGTPVSEKIYFASVVSGINSTTTSPSTCNSTGVVACFNPADYTTGTSFTSSSPQSEQWTINRNGTNLPVDIASDLSVAELSGLAAGGAASLRAIDGKAIYLLPSATSVAAGTSILLTLGGFTNIAASGAYPSTIATFDNSATPALIDSVTTGILNFSALDSSAVVGVAVDPTFSFTVASHLGACNSVAQTPGVATGATGVALGRVTSASGSIGAQDLSIGTNANTGFSLQFRTSGPFASGTNTIANAPGTNAAPLAFPSTSIAAFGYTVSGLSRFAGLWAGFETTNREVMNASSVGTVTNCIAYRVQVAASTPAGSYSSTAFYTAIPNF